MFLGISGEQRPRTKTCARPNAIQTPSSPTINIRLMAPHDEPSRKHCAPHKLQWKLGNTPAGMPAHKTGLHGSSGPVAMQCYYHYLQAMRQRLGLPFNQPAGRHPLAYKPLRISHHNTPPLKTATSTVHSLATVVVHTLVAHSLAAGNAIPWQNNAQCG
jgi:hypothetical protein